MSQPRLSVLSRFALGTALAGLLAGCASGLPAVSGPVIVPALSLAQKDVAGCGKGDLSHLNGRPFTDLAGYRLMGQLRVLRPGQGVTQDLMPTRLNAQIDAKGAILHLFCG
ncbi:MAG: I78 family peptidase inhibitor [Cypionkella sp.]|nr:I78 family peptidase inhibitor [Cypionkella sp.]